MSLSQNIWKEYKKVYEEYTNIKKWDNICILIQIGSFYDILMEEKDIKELEKISKLLNIVIGGLKNKKSELPLFIGFPKIALTKYLPVLLEDGFTVILMDEIKNQTTITRKVVETISPSLNNLFATNDFDDMNSEQELVKESGLMYIVFDIYKSKNKLLVIYGFAYYNSRLNKLNVYENIKEISIDEFETVIIDDIKRNQIYNVNEYIIEVYDRTNKIGDLNKEEFKNMFDHEIETIHYIKTNEKIWKEKNNLHLQEEYFKKLYKTTPIGIIEHLGLENVEISRYILIQMYDFIHNHNEKLLINIAKPECITDSKNMVLYMNTLKKLNIISERGTKQKSLFDIINKTQTKIGERSLKETLCKPFNTKNEIEHRLNLSDKLKTEILKNKEKLQEISNILNDICDLEKSNIKILNEILKPVEWVRIFNTFNKFVEIMDIEILNKVFNKELKIDETITELKKNIDECNKIFDIEMMNKSKYINEDGTINNFIKTGINTELDLLKIESDEMLNSINNIKVELQEKISVKGEWLKLTTIDDKYNFTCTKIRFETLNKVLSKENKEILIDVKKNTSQCRFSTKKLNEISETLKQNDKKMIELIKLEFINQTKYLYSKYEKMNIDLIKHIKIIDITICNVLLYFKMKYKRPIIKEGKVSEIKVKGIRHPIIEYINKDLEYITNDINLTNEERGIVLYALNSCGKSSLLRAVGINVILAQSGMYVACEEMEIVPFEKIITQVDMNDNLWKGQSSYITEMLGLRTILNVSNEKTLVLSDELTKGTEVISATSIFAASILELSKRNTKFIFTTHLQDVSKIEMVKTDEKIKIKHLSVIIENGKITFERKLKDGSTNELYGLEVAKVVGVDENVMSSAFQIRNDLMNRKNTMINLQKSNYNKQKISAMCEICKYIPVKESDKELETHHINFQKDADDLNFNKHFHKNSKHNLVSLCRKCHTKVHNGELTINGYIMTSDGIKLI